MKAGEVAAKLIESPDDEIIFAVCLGEEPDHYKARINRLGGFVKLPAHDNVVFVMVHLNEEVETILKRL
jgi:hypothetical protein